VCIPRAQPGPPDPDRALLQVYVVPLEPERLALAQPESVEAARCELAADFAEDLRGIEAAVRDTKHKLTAAVQAAGTTLTEVFGAGPVIAATVIAGARDISRFPSRDHFAACNSTAPVEVSFGQRKIYRLSRRGNRRPSHAIQMAAVSQVSHRHSAGQATPGPAATLRPRPAPRRPKTTSRSTKTTTRTT
jgi:transposase